MLASLVLLQLQPSLPVIPIPEQVIIRGGTRTTVNLRTIAFPRAYESAGIRLQQFMAERGIETKRVAEGKPADITFEEFETRHMLGEEGYYLKTGANGIIVRAGAPAGAFYGAITLRQMLEDNPTRLPLCEVVDKPRFAWRGMHLDVSRHFFNVDEVKQYIDYLADLKLNIFHWHLIDDGGWRMEVKSYPKLTEIGAWRTDRPGEVWNYSNIEFPGKGSGKKLYGGYYTQEEIRHVVAYAANRMITVVPEIELPGHCLPAMVAQPEVTCTIPPSPDRPYRALAYCAGKEETFRFLEEVLSETMQLFPSKVIHIGGDEVDKTYWRKCPDCQKRKADEGLSTEEQLQSYFVRRIEKFLNSKGRVLMGWDEILEGGLAPNAQVMSWRGEQGGIEAARSGHDVVMSPTSHCYFDYGYDGTSTKHVYGYEPIPAALDEVAARRVRGAQGNVWTEWMADFSKVQTMIFPRVLALSEVLWSPKLSRNWEDFEQRMNKRIPLLVEQGISVYAGMPTAAAQYIVFDKYCEVKLNTSSVPGTELRFSTDGKAPTGASKLYSGPIRVEKPTTIMAAYFQKGKMVERPITVTCVSSAPAQGAGDQLGMIRDAYLPEKTFAAVPSFSSLKPESTELVQSFSLDEFAARTSYALRYSAFFEVRVRGTYTFTLGSDDGSTLSINGRVILDNNFAQAYTERQSRAVLLPGWYKIEIGYFEQGGAEKLAAFVEGPGLAKTPLEAVLLAPK